MIWSWNKLIGVILILNKMTSLSQCFCDWRVPYFTVYYPEEGESFKVVVVAANKHYTWRKDGRQLAIETCNGRKDPNCTQPIYSTRDDSNGTADSNATANLNFREITLGDSGKYILELFCRDKNITYRRLNSFEVIVQDKPFVLIDCNDMTVYEGDNVTCVCKTTPQYPTAVVTWLWNKQGNSGVKNFTDILTLENISRNERGTYTCFVKSRNLVNKTSFNLKVVPKNSTVQIKYFNVFQEVGANCCELSLLCKAEGFPEPNYTISHRDVAVKYGNMYTVDTSKISSLGLYECLARNGASSDKRSLFMNASLPLKSCLEKEKRNSETEWKIRLIIGACSFLTGILVLYVLMCCCKKCKKEDDCENSEYDDVCPREPETLSPASENHKMPLPYTSGTPGEERENSEYDDVCPRKQQILAPALESQKMRLRYTSGRPEEQRQSAEYDEPEAERLSAKYDEPEAERLSAEYDEPEAGNSDDRVYYNESNYHKFNATRHRKEERYQF
ncbi:fasciclin 2, isoform B [Paramuricea clavata]|uniref:Fasciclin 2, isoform B n=1 Tax=Paramuricea clavata TaxID=317549 RepID=A0A6S7H4K1_PARCT|nr:fasciclin 2, isoform B [Paramuricea clavata]